MSDYEEEDEKWVQWFCSLAGNEHFCEVAQSYIEDSFNLYGLRALVPNYQDALNIILDMTGANAALLNACLLRYGLELATMTLVAVEKPNY